MPCTHPDSCAPPSGVPDPRTVPATLAASTALLLGLLLYGAASSPASAQEPQGASAGEEGSTLEVSGTGEVEVSPDRARLSFAVETEAVSAREAGEENARLMEGVIAAVREAGPEDLRVETSGYALQPRYRQGEDRLREIAGYLARNNLQIVLDDVDAVGPLVDAALEAGANRIAGLTFEVRDTEPHRREALRTAVEQARAEAEVIASALGVELGDPTRVTGGAERPPPQPLAFRAMEAADVAQATTPVEAGLQTVRASVTVVYRLHPE